MARVVINADDFGISDGVCRSIGALLEAGAVSNTTLMLGADGALERIDRWRGRDLRGIAGVHLQLTSGIPLCGPGQVPSLIDGSTGRFRQKEDLANADPDEVPREWTLQVAV